MEKTIKNNPKLTLEVLAPYLPYKLMLKTDIYTCKFLSTEQIFYYDKIRCNHFFKSIEGTRYTKPILRPLDDLHMDHPAMIEMNKLHSIEYKGENTFVEIDSLQDYPFHATYLPYECFIILLKYHFDVFQLIPAGLAVDVNTVKEVQGGE